MAQTPKTEAPTNSSLRAFHSSTVDSTVTLVELRVALYGLCPEAPHEHPKYPTVSGRKVAQTNM